MLTINCETRETVQHALIVQDALIAHRLFERATLHDGIELQMQPFKKGFAEVFLDCLYKRAMDVQLCGVQEQ